MAIVRSLSKVYRINFGKYRNRTCVLSGGLNEENMIEIVFVSRVREEAVVSVGALSELAIPGWSYRDAIGASYGLDEYATRKGDGSNKLRTFSFAQPRAFKIGDVLASGEMVIEPLRVGYNSTYLAYLKETGWVEIAARLPIALFGNKNYRYPAELKAGHRLATGCLVAKDPVVSLDWTYVCLNEMGCTIEIPSCLPLALEVL